MMGLRVRVSSIRTVIMVITQFLFYIANKQDRVKILGTVYSFNSTPDDYTIISPHEFNSIYDNVIHKRRTVSSIDMKPHAVQQDVLNIVHDFFRYLEIQFQNT